MEITKKEFKQTCRFAKKMGFYNIHIFPYSVRTGTVAEKMPQHDNKVKKERAKKLAKINSVLNKKYINSCKFNSYKKQRTNERRIKVQYLNTREERTNKIN